MKTMTYAEFAALPEGTIFEFGVMPIPHLAGIYRKGAWGKANDDNPRSGTTIINLSSLIDRFDDPDLIGAEFLPADSGEAYEFRVYEPADLDQLAGLIGRGLAAQQEGVEG